MPITGVLVTCRDGATANVRSAIQARPHSEVQYEMESELVVVTDTATLEEDRKELDWLASLTGVASTFVTYTSLEDLVENFPEAGEHS